MQPNKPNQNNPYGYPNQPQQQRGNQSQNFSAQGQNRQQNPNYQQNQNPNYQQNQQNQNYQQYPNYQQQNQSFSGQEQQPYRQPNSNYSQQNNQNQSFSGQGQQYRQTNPNYQQQQNPKYQQHIQSFPTKPRLRGENASQQSFISTGSHNQQSGTYSQQRLLEQQMRIIPKQSDFKSIQVWNQALNTLAQRKKFVTNLFQYTGQQNDKVFIYKVQTMPPIRPDAIKTWYRVINSIKPLLQKEMKMITFRGDTVWAEQQKQNFSTTTILGKKRPQQQQHPSQIPENTYNVCLTSCTPVSFQQMYGEQSKSLKPLFVQLVNTKIKQKLSQIGFEQLGKGKFYNRSWLMAGMTESKSKFGLNVIKGFRFTFCCLAPKRNYMQIDLATRILRTKNLYEEIMSSVGTQSDKISMFRGATVIARYGNHKTYKIESIQYEKKIYQYFDVRNNDTKQQITFKDYFQKHYQVQIHFDNQPLVSVIAKTQKKIGKGQKMTKKIQKIYLIPELVSLTGIDKTQRQNQGLMQEIADNTRLRPHQRMLYSQKLIERVNTSKDIKIGQKVQIQGYQLKKPEFKRAQQKFLQNPYSSLPLLQGLKSLAPYQIGYEQLVVLYSQRTQGERINTLCSFLSTASNTYRINIPEYPKIICVQQSSDKFTFIQNMKTSIQNYCITKTVQQKVSTFFIFVLDSSEQTVYDDLKNFTIKYHQIKSQMVLTDTLSKNGGGLSIAGKIGLQIAAKKGFAIWEVQKSHPYWKNKRVASSSMSYSKSTNGDFTLGFVGTTNNNQTKVYSYCSVKIPRKEAVSSSVMIDFYKNWIWQYKQTEKALPTTLIIYREGLSQAEINKRVTGQLQCLEDVIFKQVPTWHKDFQQYSPEIIFMIVNKNVRSRFYDVKKIKLAKQEQNPKDIKNPIIKQQIQNIYVNPQSGSVIYCEMAYNSQIDFFLVPQMAETGTVTPTQYKLAYYHPQKTPMNSTFNNVNLPLQAIAQFTYEQCFNYYNWDGVVKLPAVLQYAHKLAKIAGEHIKQPINMSQFQLNIRTWANTQASKYKDHKDRQQKLELIKAEMEKKLYVCKQILNSFYFL